MESVINTIIEGARTGEIGDGKIFGNTKSFLVTLFTIRFMFDTSNCKCKMKLLRLWLFLVWLYTVLPVSDVIRVRTGKNFKSHILFKRKTQILACLKTCVHVDKTFSFRSLDSANNNEWSLCLVSCWIDQDVFLTVHELCRNICPGSQTSKLCS